MSATAVGMTCTCVYISDLDLDREDHILSCLWEMLLDLSLMVMQQLNHASLPDTANAESACCCTQALLQLLLHVDPAQRPTAAAVCRHPWALDLPESPPGSPSRSLYHSPQMHAVFQDPLEHGSCGGQDRTTAEQQGVECTAEAMQHLWLQQEVLLKGAQQR